MGASAAEPAVSTVSAARTTGGSARNEPSQPQPADAKTKQQKRIPDENIAKLVAEENERKSKFPQYPGLERWELLEKMGDGAFSNVYRARDREGVVGEVAIKVVRKYEMNSMQVRDNNGEGAGRVSPSSFFFFFLFWGCPPPPHFLAWHTNSISSPISFVILESALYQL